MPFYDFWRNKSVTKLGRRWSYQAAVYTLNQLSRYVQPLQHVVELGPGRGPFAQACINREISYTAIDANAGLLKQLSPIPGVCSYVPPLPLRDMVADAAVANHVLEHAPGLPQAESMVLELRRAIRPGGVVVLTTPDLLWYKNYFWDCDYSHNFATSARRLYQMFADLNLKVVYLGYVHNHLTGVSGYLVGRLVQVIPYKFPGSMPDSSFYNDHIYKARLTFARCVLIIGMRPLEHV